MTEDCFPLPVEVYKALDAEEQSLAAWKQYLVKLRVYLEDRPGMLAAAALLIGRCGGNITLFDYNRSEDPNLVLMDVALPSEESLKSLLAALEEEGFLRPVSVAAEDLQVTDTGAVLNLAVRLHHRPGALGEFAEILKQEGANVIYMRFNEARSPESAEIAVALSKSSLVDDLLADINAHHFHYRVVFRGVDEERVQNAIGLKLTERFFLRLKRLMPDSDVDQLKQLVQSSKEISDQLLEFAHESNKDLEAGEIFTQILLFASRSLGRTGEKFTCREQAPIQVSDQVQLRTFILPTGGNIYLLSADTESIMLDCGYGLYYRDFRRYCQEHGVRPERISTIYLSHPDADHAGMSGYFQEDYGTSVFLHSKGLSAIEQDNRAWGSNSPLVRLNGLFTRLVNAFTRFRPPKQVKFYREQPIGKAGALNVIDRIQFRDVTVEVLEGLGGHVPSQVYFLIAEQGMLFSSDYLLNLDSLSTEDRELLTIPRFLMTSTNADSDTFRSEMKALEKLILDIDERLKSQKRFARVFPGHGDYYRAYLLCR